MARPGQARGVSPVWLHATSIVLLVVGVLALVVPVESTPVMPVTVAPSPQTPLASGSPSARFDETIVRTNLFSATRRAPRVRFVLPGQEPAMATPMETPVTSASDAPALLGVLTVNGIRSALLSVPGSDSIPRVVRTGERIGGYRVRVIGADRVELSSVSGTRTVRLRRSFPSDSNGVEP
jgi:hypothetical protein